jgi:hypothetical protein
MSAQIVPLKENSSYKFINITCKYFLRRDVYKQLPTTVIKA